jgi:hypothetical protein
LLGRVEIFGFKLWQLSGQMSISGSPFCDLSLDYVLLLICTVQVLFEDFVLLHHVLVVHAQFAVLHIFQKVPAQFVHHSQFKFPSC